MNKSDFDVFDQVCASFVFWKNNEKRIKKNQSKYEKPQTAERDVLLHGTKTPF